MLLRIFDTDADYLFLNFLLNSASPTKPEPRMGMVAGSRTRAAGYEGEKSKRALQKSVRITDWILWILKKPERR